MRIEDRTEVLFEHEVCVTAEDVALESLPIAASLTDSSKKLRIVFTLDHCSSPAEMGLSDDIRKLGFGLHRIDIFAEAKQ